MSKINFKRFFLFLSVLFLFSPQNAPAKLAPKVVNGVMDLSNWNFKKDGNLELKGNWKFYWKTLINPDHLIKKGPPKEDALLKVPGYWSSQKKFSKYGYGTFILEIKNPKGESLSINIPSVYSAYRLFIITNKESDLIHSVGRVGKTKNEEIPQFENPLLGLNKIKGNFYLVIHISNFHFREGKLPTIKIGHSKKLKWQYDFKNRSIFFSIGVLFIMSIYHFSLFIQRKDDKLSFYFSLFCGLISLRLFANNYFASWLFPQPSLFLFELLGKIDYFTNILGSLFSILFFNQLMSNEFKKEVKGLKFVMGLFFLIVLFFPTRIFTQKFILLPIQIIYLISYIILMIKVIIYAIKGIKFFKLVLLGGTVLLLGFIHAILLPYKITHPPELLPFALVIFVFIQSYILSIIFSNAFKESKTLSNLLEVERTGLEKTVSERTEELSNTLSKLKDVLEQRSLFFASLSHELRTPLNAILGFSKILQKTLPNNQLLEKEYVDSINTSGVSLLRLVNSVHDFTKIELNELKVIKQKFNFKKMLRTLSLHYTNESKNKGITFELVISDNVPSWIESDGLALKQVLDNLLSNALKFTKEGHVKLEVQGLFKSTDKSKFELNIKISDTGTGMSEKKIKDLFEPFSQVHEHGTTKERGSGLGLFISKKIIEDLNGKITVSSILKKGSVFTISFKDTALFNEEKDTGDISYKFFGNTVLIADDVPLNLKLYEAYFSQHDLKLEIAKDGSELIKKVKETRPDLIITDFEMPEFTADEALTILRTKGIKTPVLLVSCLVIESKVKKRFQGFLQKPVDEEVFLTEVSKFLKHEKVIIDNEHQEKPILEFQLPTNLNKEEHNLIIEVYGVLKNWRSSMQITNIENEIPPLKLKLKTTRLNLLIPLLESIENSAEKFNISKIESSLDYGIKKLKRNN